MKILRYLLPGLVILAVAGLLCYQGFVTKDLEPSDIFKGGILIAGALSTMFKSSTPRVSGNKKALYQSAYPDMIRNNFSHDKKLEKRFYSAVDDFNRGKYTASLSKLEALRKECTRSEDIYAVCCFTALSSSRLGFYDRAVKEYTAALSIHPNSRLASNMGYCYQATGKIPEAAAAYERAIAIDGQNANPYSNLASLYFQESDYESALELAEEAIQRNPNLSQALSTAAICCALLGDAEQYAVYYRRAVAAGYDGKTIKEAIQALDATV